MFTILAMAAATAAPLPSTHDKGMRYRNGAPVCRTRGVEPAESNIPPRAQRLNELPDADLILSVIRIDVDGCSKPAIIRADNGRSPRLR